MKWCFSLFADVRTNFSHWYYDQRNVRFSLSSGRRKCQTSVRTTAWTSKFYQNFHAYATTLEYLIIDLRHLRKFTYIPLELPYKHIYFQENHCPLHLLALYWTVLNTYDSPVHLFIFGKIPYPVQLLHTVFINEVYILSWQVVTCLLDTFQSTYWQ